MNTLSLTSTIMSLFNNKEGYYGSNRERTLRQKNLNMSRKELFLSSWNIKKLTSETFHNYRGLTGGKLSYSYFIVNVPKWMKTWNKLSSLDDFEDLRGNFVDTFVHVNKIFIYEHIEKLRKTVNAEGIRDIEEAYGNSTFDEITPDDIDSYYSKTPYYNQWDSTVEGEYNLFSDKTAEHSDYYLISPGTPVQNGKSYNEPAGITHGSRIIDALKQESIESTPNRDDFYVEDYRHLDFWDDNYGVYRDNSNYRYHNEIPVYQKSMQTRHYDRGNDGLHQRGSLVNDRYRKFDLHEIEDGFYAYTDE